MATGAQVKIALLGRSGIGKTSIITALLAEAKELLADTPLTITSYDERTQHLIEINRGLLEGSFFSGTFDYRAIPGNESEVQYALMMATQGTNTFTQIYTDVLKEFFEVAHPTILFAFKDYPGTWIEPKVREANPAVKQDWTKYLEWIKESSILLIPIDAPLLMEAPSPESLVRVPNLLHLPAVQEIVDNWVTARLQSELPGVMVLAPIRCESYFADNGGDLNRSAELLAQVRKLYGSVLEKIAVRDKKRLISVEYHPIDTVGAVKVAQTQWPGPTDGIETGVTITYMMRPPGRYSPKGAGDLLITLNHHLLAYWTAEREMRKRRWQDKSVIEKIIDWEEGWELVGEFLDGTTSAFGQTMRNLANMPYSKRVVQLSPA